MKTKGYIDQLLENMADELNVKQICLDVDSEVYTYDYDTITRRSLPDQDVSWGSLIFSGDIIGDMKLIREYISQGLKQRNEAGIKVRQPLQSLTIRI